MGIQFNPFTGNLDFVGTVPDPLTLNELTVNTLLTAAHIHGNIAGSFYIHIKNTDTVELPKGTPFYLSGTVGGSDRVEVKAARGDDPAKGPAIGLLETTLAVNGEGNGVILGEIFTYDTATPGWTTNQPLYVSATGGLTNVRPTTGYRQVVAYAGRIHASTGTIVVVGNQRENVQGNTGEVQINLDGGIGTIAGFRWNSSTGTLEVPGDIELDDGGTYTTTLQMVTPTADRVISFPDRTGTLALVSGSNGQVAYNLNGAQAGGALIVDPTTGAFGYGSGTGGAVTQATNKATGVTLNTQCGQITMNAAALAADTSVSFVLANSKIAANDLLLINHISGGTFMAYVVDSRCAAGSATIGIRNVTPGSLSEAIVLAFAVIKATT
jgi:hypothetical protein